MLVEYSYQNKEVNKSVQKLVGKPYSFWQRIKMNGIGSQRFELLSGNKEITDILNSKSSAYPYLNLELRPKGLILHIRVRLDNWALLIPYHSLSIVEQHNQLKLFSNKWKITLQPYGKANLNNRFISKILINKARKGINE